VGAVLITTIKVVEPVTEPEAAVIWTLPIVKLVARPEVLVVATAVLDELQLAEDVRSFLLPSLNVAVAVNCWAEPATTLRLEGVT
jgi:hypothetical protein